MFVLYDKTRKGFVTGYMAKGQLHGIAKSITYAKPFQSKKSAKEFTQEILENIKNLTGKESYKQEILDYSNECFAICVNVSFVSYDEMKEQESILLNQSNNGWISVDDALPPNSGDFWLVYTDKGRIAECRYYSDEWITTYCNNERVTHWQPRPQPPKER